MLLQANGLAIEVDDQGPPNGPPIVLIMGLGMQLIAWPEALVQRLVARGFRVIRLDNRDIGLSQSFESSGTPNLVWATLRWLLHLPVQAPYSLADMARDTVGVLDALGLARAHICGASMGGMIAQHIAVIAPERVSRLTLIMTTSGARSLPQPSAKVRGALIERPSAGPHDVNVEVERLARMLSIIGSPAYPAEPQALRVRLAAMVRRAWRPSG